MLYSRSREATDANGSLMSHLIQRTMSGAQAHSIKVKTHRAKKKNCDRNLVISDVWTNQANKSTSR